MPHTPLMIPCSVEQGLSVNSTYGKCRPYNPPLAAGSKDKYGGSHRMYADLGRWPPTEKDTQEYRNPVSMFGLGQTINGTPFTGYMREIYVDKCRYFELRTQTLRESDLPV